MDDSHFDKIADAELHHLDGRLASFDPDEVEAELASGVLTITLADGAKIVVNSHRAAGQIWMAAFRTAWHFSPRATAATDAGEIRYEWRTDRDELRATLGRVLGERLGRPITL